ncbi:MAG TPA: hybrid sensor histidine kinase/response regulator [Campylobacterales bacterium]|nr:hybrid sensor histidine kinase/response regulator [Campylobacterales bacterium]
MDDLQEILEDFLVEAFELIEQMDQDLVELENNPEDLELLNSIFRVAHTVKGSSSFLNFDILTELTHHMEDVLNKARRDELKITAGVMDVILESVDMMKALLEGIQASSVDTECGIEISAIVAKLDAVSKGEEVAAIPVTEVSQPIAEVEEEAPIVEEVVELDINYEEMSDDDVEAEIQRLIAEKFDAKEAKKAAKAQESVVEPTPAPAQEEASTTPQPVAEAPTPTPAPIAKKEAPKQESVKKQAMAPEQTIRVEVKRLDHLMNLIGELVLSKNRLLKIYDDVEERYEGEKFLEELNQVVSAVSLVTTDLQIAVMKTRMLPVSKVFNRFPRLVRDLSRDLNKDIDLVMSGEETELDKSIVEEIGDPLVHMIRNSCDHGVEDPATRVAAGKPEKGTVNLKAYNEGNQIVIEIKDDGAGMDPGFLKMKALEKNVITDREADNMSDKEAFGLIFRPGFSTASKVTGVSGRGVGMDVVKTNIEKLNGLIDIDSEIGKGSTFKLKIPLTLAIMQALLVSTQEEFFAIPLSSVLETVRVSMDEIYTIEGKNVLKLRDEVLSLVRLSDMFGVDEVFDNGEHAYVVVIGLAESKLGIVVDGLVGQEEIVIKSMGDYLKGIEGIAGATIRGDGGVTLITDVAAMMHLAKDIKVDVTQKSALTESKQKNSPSDYNVMVVDDSKTDRTIMRKSLEPLGVTLTEATNGVEALSILKAGDIAFDAMLVDIEMPQMDGYTLASEIRKYSKYRNLPLLAVTSRTSKSDRLRGVEVGMTEYITKPYSPDYLRSAVSKNIKLPEGAIA